MLIEEHILKHWIDNFYGYGSWHAKIWFVGYEESGGDVPEEVADKINYFYRVHPTPGDGPLCDIRDLYRNVGIWWEGHKADIYSNRYDYRFGLHATQHGVWKNLIAFEHGYHNKKIPDLLEYQKNSFARTSLASEALIPLYPLPSPHNHAWYYSWLDVPGLDFIKTRSLYEQHVYHSRIHKILSRIDTYKPEAVLMYGMNNINTLKRSVQEHFQSVKFTLIKSTKMQIPQHHRADINGTTLLLTTQIPALRHNRTETGFDWEEMGRRVAIESH
jgi:hypothetical protein